jgi:CelD/BcsL family acetyltransferase involved in cellulose biosynthesis
MRKTILLNIIEINTLDEFLGLRDVWNRVLARSRDDNIFLTWEYLSTFWKYFGKNAKLRIVCVRDRDEIVAIAPYRQSRFNFVGPLGYDVIEPLGYRGLMLEGGDYTGLLLGEKETECLKLFLKYLEEHNNWDFIYMYDVPETSAIPDLLRKTTNSTLKFEITKGAICPYITLPQSMNIFLEGLYGKFRKNLRRCMRHLMKDYGKVELKKYNQFGSVKDAMETFFKLHQKRWASKQMPGVFNTQTICDFYLDVARKFADNGWLALYFLAVNDEPIAAHYCFEYKQKMYFALSGFDLSYARYSVGNLLTLKIIEKCIEEGLQEFDFMKGDEPYKSKWTGTYKINLEIKFVNKKLTSRLYNWGIRKLKKAKIDKALERLSFFSLKRGMF